MAVRHDVSRTLTAVKYNINGCWETQVRMRRFARFRAQMGFTVPPSVTGFGINPLNPGAFFMRIHYCIKLTG